MLLAFCQTAYADQPPTPANFNAVVYSQTAAELFWQRTTDSSSISAYEITRNGNVLGVFDALSLFQNDLTAGVNYTYDIAAIDREGNRSATSTISFTGGVRTEIPEQERPAVPNPTNLRVAVYSSSALELFWDRVTTDALRYEVMRNGQSLGITNGTSFFIEGLAANQLYAFDVQAINNDDDRSVVSSVEVGSSTQPPNNDNPEAPDNDGTLQPPQDPTLTVYSTSAAELIWSNSSTTTLGNTVEVGRNDVIVASSDGISFYDDARPVDTNVTYSLTTVAANGQRSESIQIGQFESARLDTNVGLLATNDDGNIAVSGNTAVLPADLEITDSDVFIQGAVYVFTRDNTGVWGQTQRIITDENSERFGRFAAIDGDTLAISHRDSGDTTPPTGSIRGVTMYTRDSSGQWVVSQRISAQIEASARGLGSNIAISGNTMMIQATIDLEGTMVFVYERNSDGEWIQQQELLLDDGNNSFGFGSAITIDGNTAIIGDHQDLTNGFSSGAAWIYTKDASGSWTAQQQLQPNANSEGDEVGSSVALEGDVAVLGGNESDTVYIFRRDTNGNWSQTQTLDFNLTDNVTFTDPGTSVGLDDGTLAVGANAASALGRLTGAIYLYQQTDNVWTQSQILASSNGQGRGLFGTAVDIDDGTVVGSAFPPFIGDRPRGFAVTGYAFDVN